MQSDVAQFKNSKHRVLFQNAEGNINAGVWFNDPDVELQDICWHNTLANQMFLSVREDEGLISIDEEFGTQSCYVELHRFEFDHC